MRPRFSSVVLVGAGLLGLPVRTAAHHSQAMFETAQVTLPATITRFQYTPPHIRVLADVEVDGRTRRYRLEGGSPQVLRKLGWGPQVLAPGARVSITFSKARDGSNAGLLRSLRKADGTMLPAASGEEAPE